MVSSDIKKLEELLRNVPDSYPEFVWSVSTGCEHYKDKNDKICEQLLDYFSSHPNPMSSDVLEYYANLIGIPYGDDDGKWYRWGREITEEEAERISQEYAED